MAELTTLSPELARRVADAARIVNGTPRGTRADGPPLPFTANYVGFCEIGEDAIDGCEYDAEEDTYTPGHAECVVWWSGDPDPSTKERIVEESPELDDDRLKEEIYNLAPWPALPGSLLPFWRANDGTLFICPPPVKRYFKTSTAIAVGTKGTSCQYVTPTSATVNEWTWSEENSRYQPNGKTFTVYNKWLTEIPANRQAEATPGADGRYTVSAVDCAECS